MAATLQEVELASLPSGIAGHDQKLEVLAIHRRSQTLLSVFQDKNTGLAVYESNVCNKSGVWQACQKPWGLPPKSPWTVTRVLALEALDCFVFVCNHTKKAMAAKKAALPAHASLAERRARYAEEKAEAENAQIASLIFCDLSLTEVNRYNISQCTKNTISACDFDQNRKELVLGCLGGRIQSYSLRFVEASRQGKAHYIGVFRLHTRLCEDAGKVPVQIATQDVSACCLVLSKLGGISAFANGTLEQMWFVSNTYFRYEPKALFTDKFGGNFVVHCAAAGGSAEILEYWKPPGKFLLAEAGEFERSVLPLNGRALLALTLESISSSTGTFIVYITDDGIVQLWRPASLQGEMRLDSELKIKVSTTAAGNLADAATSDQKLELSMEGNSSAQANVVDMVVQVKAPAPVALVPGALQEKRAGLITFIQNHELPDCPISLFVIHGADVCIMALHAPNDTNVPGLRGASLALAGQGDGGGLDYSLYENYTGGPPLSADGFFAAKKDSDARLMGKKTALLEQKRLQAEAEMQHKLLQQGFDESKRERTPIDDSIVDLNSRVPTAEDGTRPNTTSHYLSERLYKVLEDPLDPYSMSDSQTLSAVDSLAFAPMDPGAGYADSVEGNLGGLEREIIDFNLITPTAKEIEIDAVSPAFSVVPKPFFAPSQAQRRPTAFHFTPMKMLRDYDASVDEADQADGVGVLRLLKPPSLVLTTSRKKTDLKLITEKGLYPTGGSSVPRMLDFTFIGITPKAGSLGLVTVFNQGFVFDVRPQVRSGAAPHDVQPPIRMDLNIRQQAKATAILVADVSVMTSHTVTRKGRKEVVEEEMDGLQTLCFFGDSDGRLNYCLCDRLVTLHTDSFDGHTSPVVSIVATADACAALWRVGTERIPRKKEMQILPKAAAGSAIVTLAQNGEVKVWQPLFIDMHNVASSKELIFNVCGLKWRCSGVFTCRIPNQIRSQVFLQSGNAAERNEAPVAGSASRCFLDPTGMSLVVAFSDGSLEQWPIPGLLDATGLSTTRERVWRKKRHRGAISECRVSMHGPSTCIRGLKTAEQKKSDPDAKKKDLSPIISQIGGGGGQEAIGYTLKELKVIADSSCLVTSSEDGSVVLWRFALSQDDPHSSFKYLNPSPIRRFAFSSPPSAGICYSTSDTSKPATQSVWRLTVIVNGVLITATHGIRSEAFRVNKFLLNDADFDAAAVQVGGADEQRRQQSQDKVLQSVPVICSVEKPSLTAEMVSKKVGKNQGTFSWLTLDFWTNKKKNPAEQKISTQFTLDDNVTFDGVDKKIPSRGVAWEESLQTGDISKVNVEVESTKEYKPEVAKEGKKKVFLKGVALTVPEHSSVASAERLMKDDDGIKRYLATGQGEFDGDDDINDELDDFEMLAETDNSTLQQFSEKFSVVLPDSQVEVEAVKPPCGSLEEESVLSLNSIHSVHFKEAMTDSLVTAEVSSEVSPKGVSSPLKAATADALPSKPTTPKSKRPKAVSPKREKVEKVEVAEEDKIIGELGEVKQTRVQQMKKKEIEKLRARQMASSSINPKVMYRSKPRETGDTGTKQISGNAAVFTVPVNFSDQQVMAASRKVIVETVARKSRVAGKPQSAGDQGSEKVSLLQKTADASFDNESHALKGTGPLLVDFAAPSIFYGKPPTTKKGKHQPGTTKKPKIDPSLIPEGSDALSLVGQALYDVLTDIQLRALDCLVDIFSDKDMDTFETLLDKNKTDILSIIGVDILAREASSMIDLKESVSKGKIAMKKMQLANRQNATKGRKGLTQILQVADPEAEPDILLTIKSASIYDVEVMLMTPNTGAKIHMFAMLDTELPQQMPPDSALNGSLAEIKQFPGVCAVAEQVLDEKQSEHFFNLSGLKPGRGYKIFAFMVCVTPLERTFRVMTVDDCVDCLVNVKTLPEIVDVHWSSLTPEMQDTEIRAALRAMSVLAANQAQEVPLSLPTEKDFAARDPDTSAGRAAIKKLRLFIAWWAPDAFAGLSPHRKEFLFRESLYACKDEDVAKKYVAAGFIDADGLKELHAIVDKVSEDKDATKLEESLLDGNQAFFDFRSWYGGGQVILDWEEDQYNLKLAAPANTAVSVDNSKLAMSDDDISVGSEFADAEDAGEFSPQLPTINRQARTLFLEECYKKNVDSSKEKTQALIDIYKVAEKQGLSERDLTLRRQKLSDDDIDMIMASMKIIDLCIAKEFITKGKRLDPSMLGKGQLSAQNICGCDIFAPINEATLIPEKPPSLVMATLPGGRRPIRPWQLCTPEEQNYEIALACSLDYILELAIMDGVSVPDLEDVDLDSKIAPMRAQRWKDFAKWYAGEEGIEKIPGKGIPTMARVLIAEEWEGKSLYEDCTLLKSLIQMGIPISEDLKESNEIRLQKISEGDFEAAAAPLPKDQKDDLLIAYENSLNSSVGVAIRIDLFKFYLNAIIKSRRQLMLNFLWPPGPARSGHQFLFPRLGLITPQIEMPDARIQVFPSKSNASYTHAQILGWYSAAELDEDDELMFEAEEDGRRRRAYLEWLSMESERCAEGRLMMLAEDKEGQIRRKYFDMMEIKFGAINKLSANQNKTDFSLTNNLPGHYEFIQAESNVFEDGTGVDNEDELEDIRQAQVEAAEKAKADAAEKKRKYDIELKRRAREEEQRVRREETDRRLAENTERRRQVREHIEELKRRRANEAEDEKRKARDAAAAAEEIRFREDEEKRVRKSIEYQILCLAQDREQMAWEDEYIKSLNIRTFETRLMEHEDITSTMRGMNEKRVEAQNTIRVAELEEIYEPFVPYEFKPEKVRLPALHSILSDTAEQSDAFASIYRSKFSEMDSSHIKWTEDDLLGLTEELAEDGNVDWEKVSMVGSIESTDSRPFTAEDSELLGPLSIDESFVGKWFKIPKNVDDLQTLLIHSMAKREETKRLKKERKKLKAVDQEPIIWKGLSKDALLMLEADKERYEVSKGMKRPATSGGNPAALTATGFPVAKYVLTDRSSPIRRPNTADSVMRPSNRLEPLNVTKDFGIDTAELVLGERGLDESNRLMDQSASIANQIDTKRKKLADVLIKNAEVAKTVMQSQRLQSLSSKKLTLASLAALDNYDESGKRKYKPRSEMERRAEPLLIADANKTNRDEVRNYVDATAVQGDKFYLESVMPGVRKEPSVDDTVRKFTYEMQEPAETMFERSSVQSTSMTLTSGGVNRRPKKYKLVDIVRSDTGKPNDIARFNKNNKYKAKDVAKPKSGFGILGSTIPIKDIDPRLRSKKNKQMDRELEAASELQLFSHIEASAIENSLMEDIKGGSVEAYMPSVSHISRNGNDGNDDVNKDLDGPSVESLLTEGSVGLKGRADPNVFLDIDDATSVNSGYSQESAGVLSKPASIAVSVKSLSNNNLSPLSVSGKNH